MRNYLILMSATALAACGGGGGPEAVGGDAPPPAPGGNGTPTPTAHSFVAPTQDKTYDAVGAVHGYNYDTIGRHGTVNELYAGDASTARDGGITIAYDPRDAIFEMTINRPKANMATGAMRFQDPAHRTDFGGARGPQAGVPNMADKQVQYLETGTASGPPRPLGKPVPAYSTSLGGEDSTSRRADLFLPEARHHDEIRHLCRLRAQPRQRRWNHAEGILDADGILHLSVKRPTRWNAPRSPMASARPTARCRASGSATFSGDMIASMVFNPDIDTSAVRQHLFPVDHRLGDAHCRFRHARHSLQLHRHASATLLGTPIPTVSTRCPKDRPSPPLSRATIDLVGKGGSSVSSTARPSSGRRHHLHVDIAGSSIDGAFFGPAAEEIGGGFRIVGGTPDERIDILGAFTGKK